MVTATKRTGEECPDKVKTQQPGDVAHPAPRVYLEKPRFQRDKWLTRALQHHLQHIATCSTQNVHRHTSPEEVIREHDGKRLSHAEEGKNALCTNIVLSRGNPIKWSQSESEHCQSHRKYLKMHITNWFRREQTDWATEKQTSDCRRN